MGRQGVESLRGGGGGGVQTPPPPHKSAPAHVIDVCGAAVAEWGKASASRYESTVFEAHFVRGWKVPESSASSR